MIIKITTVWSAAHSNDQMDLATGDDYVETTLKSGLETHYLKVS